MILYIDVSFFLFFKQLNQLKATELAKLAISSFDGIGIYGVELFLRADGSILLNEIAPRSNYSKKKKKKKIYDLLNY